MKRGGPLKRNATMRRQTRVNKVNERRKAKRKAKYDAYLRSPEWKARRRACIERAGHRCENVIVVPYMGDMKAHHRCQMTTTLTAHHLTYARFQRELPEDLQCLCKKCHEYVESQKGTHHFRKRAG